MGMAPSAVPAEIQAARDKLKAKFANVQTGDKGSVRRKKVVKHANIGADDKQLQAQLKRFGCNTIPGIEEVNMFKDDGEILHFAAPTVQAAVQSNTFVVSGHGENKKMEELLPGIISQLGTDSLASLKKLAEQFAAQQGTEKKTEEGDDEDIPDVGEDFEEVSKS